MGIMSKTLAIGVLACTVATVKAFGGAEECRRGGFTYTFNFDLPPPSAEWLERDLLDGPDLDPSFIGFTEAPELLAEVNENLAMGMGFSNEEMYARMDATLADMSGLPLEDWETPSVGDISLHFYPGFGTITESYDTLRDSEIGALSTVLKSKYHDGHIYVAYADAFHDKDMNVIPGSGVFDIGIWEFNLETMKIVSQVGLFYIQTVDGVHGIRYWAGSDDAMTLLIPPAERHSKGLITMIFGPQFKTAAPWMMPMDFDM